MQTLERRPSVEYRAGPEGERGPRGPQGERGPQGLPGRDGKDGLNGIDGRDGKDGRDAEVNLLDWTLEIKRLANKRIEYAVMRSDLNHEVLIQPTYGSDGYMEYAVIQRVK